MATVLASSSPAARLPSLTILSIHRSFSSSAPKHASGQFKRSDFLGQGHTSYYEAGQPTVGPLADASRYGAPRITPKTLKQHLDQFVVGQERAKKVLSVAVYNHYQRVEELQRQDEEERELFAQQQAKWDAMHRHPVEDEWPGQQPTTHIHGTSNPSAPSPPPPPRFEKATNPLFDYSPLTIEKSNVMLLGPSGVGKTLMAKTLARVLDVPFSMSDCTPFTQAGYIGEDADVCVQRLLAAANYDVAKAERGIICLDEIDKIATAKVSHGKDVSGEGVQQALLKIIEGTTVQVQAKPERGSGRAGPGHTQPLGGASGGSSGPAQPQQPGKGEVYNVQTDNILFICTGAFIGLHKLVLDRISKGSIGFGAAVRLIPNAADSTDPTIRGDAHTALFRKHLPFFTAAEPSLDPDHPNQHSYNALDLVEPADLQKYGLIPELVGRIPVSCALSALDENALVRVLTEPRNSLLRQYEQLFQLSGVELRFTSGALHQVARDAAGMGTGARGLRTVMERLLGDSMFETPGSHIKHILVTEAIARREEPPIYLLRGQQPRFHALIAAEEEQWEANRRREADKQSMGKDSLSSLASSSTFEQYREKVKVAGQG